MITKENLNKNLANKVDEDLIRIFKKYQTRQFSYNRIKTYN